MILLIFNGYSTQRVHVGESRAYYASGYFHKIPDCPLLHKGSINEWVTPDWFYDMDYLQTWFDLAWDNKNNDPGKKRSLLKFSHTIAVSNDIARSFGRKHGYVVYQEHSALDNLLSLDYKQKELCKNLETSISMQLLEPAPKKALL